MKMLMIICMSIALYFAAVPSSAAITIKEGESVPASVIFGDGPRSAVTIEKNGASVDWTGIATIVVSLLLVAGLVAAAWKDPYLCANLFAVLTALCGSIALFRVRTDVGVLCAVIIVQCSVMIWIFCRIGKNTQKK